MSKRKKNSKKNKRSQMTAEQRLIHSPSPMHLAACQQGAIVFRDKTKYTRKGKERFDPRKVWD